MKVAIKRNSSGFTIVELLVVIVVIGILAAITIVSYSGISQKANITSLTSDLDNASRQLKLYYVDHGAYPTSLDGNNCPLGSAPSPDTRYCLKSSNGTTFTYANVLPSTFSLKATNSSNTTAYSITNSSLPTVAAAACPAGFIPIPGSSTYGTNDFCVMKYEAKQVGVTTTPVSQAAGTPWVNISQTTAITNSPNVAGCIGCHLITEAEWMTIAQNVLSIASNWDNGAGVHMVGTGYIYSGHNDNAPANALAVTNTNDGYSDTGNSAPSNQRRTLTLSNGEVIWDISGNVWEWTSGTVQSPTVQPGVTGGGLDWREWTAVTNPGTTSPNPSASATSITGASSWNSGNGIGRILSNTEEAGLRGFLRGNAWYDGVQDGVLALYLYYAPINTGTDIGFRVSR